MAFAAAAIAIVGALVQGRQQANEMRQQAKAQQYQAQVERNAAAQAAQQAGAEQERARRESRQILGEQRVGIAQSGTAFSGSNLDIIRQDTINAELDALNIQYEGEVRRRGLLNQAEASEYNARQLRTSAKNVMRTRWLNALGAGVGAYGGAGGKMYLGKQPGRG